MFNATQNPSLEAVQALLILALWSPAVGRIAPDLQDSGKIAAAATKMALTLGLHSATKELVDSRKNIGPAGRSRLEQQGEDTLMFKARLVSRSDIRAKMQRC
jgi:hypothetical protein